MGFPDGSINKESLPAMQEMVGLIFVLGRSPGEGNGNPLQYSCLKNAMDTGAWQAIVHGVRRIGHNLVTKTTTTKITSLGNRDNFTSSFPIWMLFVSFFCLIVPTRTSNALLNRSGESRHPWFCSCLRGNAFSLVSLSMMLAVVFSYMVYILKKLPFILN